jgi:hypothetical protein
VIWGYILSKDKEFFCSPKCPHWLWGPTQPPIQWVVVAIYLYVKWPGHVAHLLPASSAEVKELMELYI